MDYANLVLKSILCSFLLHFVPRDTDLYELSHIYACSLAFYCIWQMGEVSRRLKGENKVRRFIPLEPSCLSSLQTTFFHIILFPRSGNYFQPCSLIGFQLLSASGQCTTSCRVPKTLSTPLKKINLLNSSPLPSLSVMYVFCLDSDLCIPFLMSILPPTPA